MIAIQPWADTPEPTEIPIPILAASTTEEGEGLELWYCLPILELEWKDQE